MEGTNAAGPQARPRLRRSTLAVVVLVVATLAVLTVLGTARSQPVPAQLETVFLHQGTDHPSSLRLMTQAEHAELGDPFFRLVLDGHADARDLDALEALLQPDPSRRHTFVVSENLLDPQRGHPLRAVIGFTGAHQGQVLDANVMLSVGFSTEGFSSRPAFIEAWGWDNFRGRYNYYKLDGEGLPDGLQLWKFRGSSDGADLLSAADRRGTCMACHTNGAPVMKELAFPWNNWHSDRFPVAALRPGSDWPVAADERLGSRLRGAEALETRFIVPAIDQFNNRRVNAALERRDADGDVQLDAEGRARVMEGPRLLKHLFVTTEINMASANQASNLFPGTPGDRPDQPVEIPSTFFLDAHLIGGNRPVRLDGLGVLEAARFNQHRMDAEIERPFAVSPDEYRQLVLDSGQRIAEVPGADTGFAWFVPIASHMDNSMAERLVRRGVVTRRLVAAIAAVDLETPVFSAERQRLLAHVPETFRFTPGGSPSGDGELPELERSIVASLEASDPAPGSPEALFLERLTADDPVALLRQDVVAYRARLATKLSDPATRPAELRRLFDLAHDRRQEFLAVQIFAPLEESALLFPRR